MCKEAEPERKTPDSMLYLKYNVLYKKVSKMVVLRTTTPSAFEIAKKEKHLTNTLISLILIV